MTTSDRDPPAPEAPATGPGPPSVSETVPEASIESAPASTESGPRAAPAGDSARPKKRRRKRRKDSEKPQSEMRPELDAKGRERPRFLLAFPKDAELETLLAAFEAGNYAQVRNQAPKLIETSEEPQVQAAAREILRRIEPDPLVKLLLFIAVLLFAIVVAYVYSHA